MGRAERRTAAVAVFVLAAVLLAAPSVAQIGQLVSPGSLTKAHGALEGASNCQKCHDPGRNVTAALCLSCHKPVAERIRQKKGVHREVTDDCVGCHVEHQGADNELRPLDRETFDHATETGFVLDGRHAPLAADCAKCHKTRSFLTASPSCNSCHSDAHKGAFGVDCLLCHRTEVPFKEAKQGFDHTKSAFPLIGAHQRVDCAKCHKPETAAFPAVQGTAVRLKGMASACASCHTDQHLGQMGTACERCHSPNGWRVISRAFHKIGVFPLEGRHLAVECASCHLNGAIKGTPTKCYDCHWIRRQDDRYRTRLGTDCGSCHRPISWTAVNWNHGAMTGVPLSPVHRALGCDGCHKSQTFQRGGVMCFSCHAEDYQKAKNPSHVTAGFPTACEACHRASHSSWSQTTFSHNSYFPLSGVHATQACASCHKNNIYRGTPRDCIGCHRANYDRTTSPPHAAAGFPVTCDSCHRVTDSSWTGATFNHNTTFALVGVHATQPCAACHKNNVYRGTPRDCVGCHRANYDRTTSPPHAAAGFPTTCESCHKASDASWRATFSHNTFFALVGTHAAQPCAACHKNNVYKGTPRDCVGCHRANYDRTTSPQHAAAGFPTTCESCHRASDSSWRATFNHNTFFALVGTHAAQPCAACHKNNVYKGTPRDCVGCHRANYDRTTNPNHAAAGIPTTCEQCHNAAGSTWRSTFNHSATYPLVGRHAAAPCASCHINNVYRGTPRDCVGCHRANYDRTTSPPHAAAGFPTTCEQCHRASDTGWKGARFNHSPFFVLVGLHATQPCTACHVNNVYKGTPRDCIGCHRADYDRTTRPNHVAAGFPTTCEQCHSPAASNWSSSFDHNRFFPLLGRHLSTPCASCHKNNVYRGTPRECYPCHRSDYDATSRPNHRAAGFPTTCEVCHRGSDTGWNQGRFNHTWFPITSGKHAGRQCAECHQDPNNYKVFQCTTACHPRSRVDDEHRGRAGYRYDSAACYSCHPTGRGD